MPSEPESDERLNKARMLAADFASRGGTELDDVLVVNAPVGPLRIVSVELYDDGVVVRWIRPRIQADVGGPRLTLGDDVGTMYAPSAFGSHGNNEVERGESSFAPGVPKTATALRLRFNDEHLAVRLGGEAGEY